MPTVPCNNDLLAANIIDAGDRLWLIDYEYSGNNDPFFEIGNLWSEAAWTPDDLERLVDGVLRPAVGRAHVPAPGCGASCRKYGWTLWASIQDGASDLDFDFWEWGMEKYDRAVAEFDGADFGRCWRRCVHRLIGPCARDRRPSVSRPGTGPVPTHFEQGRGAAVPSARGSRRRRQWSTSQS